MKKNIGLNKHEASSMHVEALSLWKEQQIRIFANQSVITLVNDNNQLVKKRYYVKIIAQIIQFLCINELPLRGHNSSSIITLDKSSDDEPSGLFMKLFEYALLKDEKLRNAFASNPKNATYTSPMIQNEMVKILKKTCFKK